MNGFARSRPLAAALALLLGACARPGGGEPHVLRIADNVDPASLNPLLAHDQDTIGYDLLVTQTLVGLDARNRLVPVLIERLPTRANGGISPDGTRIVYHLRRGVRFADGVPLTSADVAFTYRAILDPRNPVESQDAYRRIAALQTPDAHTVVIRLRKPWNAAVAELFAQADFAFGILPKHAFASTDVTRGAWNQHPFGTGPFRVVEWSRGNRIVLDRNPYFRPRPRLRRTIFALIPSVESSLVELRSGEVDVAEAGAAQIPSLQGLAGIRLAVTPVNGEYMLLLQTAAGPTADVHLRRAIAAAVDAQELVRGRYGTLSAADSFLPPLFAWHDPDPAATRANLARAKRELALARWKKGERLTLDYTPERGTWMETLLQAQLRRAGIGVDLKPFPPAIFNGPSGPLRSGRFEIALAQWIGGADPEQSVITACSQRGPNGNNSPNYCNPRFDALFEDQATTGDPRRRGRDFVEMQRIVRADVPLVPLAFESNVDAIDRRASGFERNMLLYPVDAPRWDARP
ncbi:MAG TPA: peptide ABC transporter substrate-binding protein [Verrucomicrobiae bacterium]|nr:peptide ABC transporter substrate-binding protein [Verrucomicrobiae bacterium]